MRVLFVTSEVCPLAKTGGLADVSRSLPIALTKRGVDARVLLPGYPGALARLENSQIAAKLEPKLGISNAVLIRGTLPGTGVPVLLVDAPSLFRREGGLYQRADGQDWQDNAVRFAFLSHVAAQVALDRAGLSWQPDIVHSNDWHTGLLPYLLARSGSSRPGTVFTAHNMAFQGNFGADVGPEIGLPADCMSADSMEFYGQLSFLKSGIRYADKVTTVSPTYSREILTAEGGCGLDGVLRSRGADLSGILNGIDDCAWNPATDTHLSQTFRANGIAGKRSCKLALQRELGLPADPEIPLVGFVSRIAHQKMADVILDALPWLVEQGAQFVLVGKGEDKLERGFEQLQRQHPDSVAVRIGYEEGLAHRLQAGCDVLLAPARFEPCGLTQLYALRYGTLPVVRRTGGLADTVVDATPETLSDRSATGFVFIEPTRDGLIAATERALAFYREPLAWRRLQLQAMAQDFSWNASAGRYIALYHQVGGASLPINESTMSIESPRQAAM